MASSQYSIYQRWAYPGSAIQYPSVSNWTTNTTYPYNPVDFLSYRAPYFDTVGACMDKTLGGCFITTATDCASRVTQPAFHGNTSCANALHQPRKSAEPTVVLYSNYASPYISFDSPAQASSTSVSIPVTGTTTTTQQQQGQMATTQQQATPQPPEIITLEPVTLWWGMTVGFWIGVLLSILGFVLLFVAISLLVKGNPKEIHKRQDEQTTSHFFMGDKEEE